LVDERSHDGFCKDSCVVCCTYRNCIQFLHLYNPFLH
jgi:hypothetical protein